MEWKLLHETEFYTVQDWAMEVPGGVVMKSMESNIHEIRAISTVFIPNARIVASREMNPHSDRPLHRLVGILEEPC